MCYVQKFDIALGIKRTLFVGVEGVVQMGAYMFFFLFLFFLLSILSKTKCDSDGVSKRWGWGVVGRLGEGAKPRA